MRRHEKRDLDDWIGAFGRKERAVMHATWTLALNLMHHDKGMASFSFYCSNLQQALVGVPTCRRVGLARNKSKHSGRSDTDGHRPVEEAPVTLGERTHHLSIVDLTTL